jgi:FkbM family methyltransferase
VSIDAILHDLDFRRSAPHETLRKCPLGFVDVGARGGVHEVVAPLAGVTAVLGFEPDRAEALRLGAQAAELPWAAFEVEACGLAATEGEATLHLLSAPTNHSLRPPNRPFTDRYRMLKFAEVGTERVRTRTLDQVLFGDRSGESQWGELIKLDTQGTELEILRGAERTLAERSVALMVEVAFCEIYAGQALFSELELWLRQRGFSFYGFSALHYRSRKLLDKRLEAGRERALWSDAIFFRDPLPGGPPTPALSERQLHVLFCCALLLGYHDFALELAGETWASAEEHARVERLVRRLAANPPERARTEVERLAAQVEASPAEATLQVGRFVDRHRHLSDCDDVPPS